MQQNLAQSLSERCASGFTCDQNIFPLRPQALCKPIQVGAFSRAIDPLQGDEFRLIIFYIHYIVRII